MSDFQARVLIARSVGIGPRFSTAEVRALLAARLVGLTQGAAGLSPALAERIAAMLNKGVHPVVPPSPRWARATSRRARTPCCR
jgi:histidine ammonia-lyase